jgi:hypothetical protein
MPKTKGIYVDLPKLLYRDTIDKILLGYVLGFRNRNVLKILEVREACKDFMADLNLTEEDYSLDTAVNCFYRMFNEYKQIREYNENLSNKERGDSQI